MPAGDVKPGDRDLIEQFHRGNVQAFNEIVLRYRERIYWVARRMTGNHDDADDVVQEAFVKAYEHLGSFRAEASLYTWLYRIAMNVSLNLIRKRNIREFLRIDDFIEMLDSGESATDAPLIQKEYQTLLEQAVATLPPKQKMVFIMKFYDEISFEEMSKMLKKSVGGLKANYFHAMQKVQQYMKKAMS